MISIFVMQCQVYHTFSGFWIFHGIQISNNPFFQFPFICRFYNPFWISAFQIYINAAGTCLICSCLGHIQFCNFFSVFIGFQNSVAKSAQRIYVYTNNVAQNTGAVFFPTSEPMVADYHDGPAFIQEMQEGTQIVVGCLIGSFSKFQNFAFIQIGIFTILQIFNIVVSL